MRARPVLRRPVLLTVVYMLVCALVWRFCANLCTIEAVSFQMTAVSYQLSRFRRLGVAFSYEGRMPFHLHGAGGRLPFE